MKILILGGTGEARELAGRLVGRGHTVMTSLAGRTTSPMLPEGELRVGKFGGIPGLDRVVATGHLLSQAVITLLALIIIGTSTLIFSVVVGWAAALVVAAASTAVLVLFLVVVPLLVARGNARA